MTQTIPRWVREAAIDPLGDLTAGQKQLLWMIGLAKVQFDWYLKTLYVDGNHMPQSDLDALIRAGVVEASERSIPMNGPNLDFIYVPRLTDFGRAQFQRIRESRRPATTPSREVD